AFCRKRDHEHADDIKCATGGHRPCCTKAIGDIADERRQSTHQEQRQRIGEGPYLAPNAEVGSDWLLEDTEALARTNANRQDQSSADDRDPETAFLRFGGHIDWGRGHGASQLSRNRGIRTFCLTLIGAYAPIAKGGSEKRSPI